MQQTFTSTALPSPLTSTSARSTPPILSEPTASRLLATVQPSPAADVSRPIPTSSSTLFDHLEASLATALQASPTYQAIVQRQDIVLQIVPVTTVPASAQPTLVVIWVAINTGKGGQRTVDLSPIVASVFQPDHEAYTETWNTRTWSDQTNLENPFWSAAHTGWLQRQVVIRDLTGDGQAELVLAGCGGFGNTCFYSAAVWTLDGRQVFTTAANSANGGSTVLWSQSRIVTRTGLDYKRVGAADERPSQWQLDFYDWDGSTFSKTETRIVPFVDYDTPVLDGK